jgi:hypothetical protein
MAEVERGAGLDHDTGRQEQQNAPQRRIGAFGFLVGMIVHDGTGQLAIRGRMCAACFTQYQKGGVGIRGGTRGDVINAA